MNCADARHLIHLDAGGDLLSDEELTLAGHMERCAECRAYNSGMLKAMGALQTLRDFDAGPSLSQLPARAEFPGAGPTVDTQSGEVRKPLRGLAASGSVWSELSRRLPASRSPLAVRKQFNTRVAALCAGALMLASISIVQSLPVTRYSPVPAYHMPGQFSSYGSALPVSQDTEFVREPRFQHAVANGTSRSPDPVADRFPVLNPDGTLAGYLQFQSVGPDTDPAASF